MTMSPLDVFTRAIAIGNPDVKITVTADGGVAHEILFHDHRGNQIPLFVDVLSDKKDFAVFRTRTFPKEEETDDKLSTTFFLKQLDQLVAFVLRKLRTFSVFSHDDTLAVVVKNTLLDLFEDMARAFVAHAQDIDVLVDSVHNDAVQLIAFAELDDAKDYLSIDLAEKAGRAVSEADADAARQMFYDVFLDFTRHVEANMRTDLRVIMFVLQNGIRHAKETFNKNAG